MAKVVDPDQILDGTEVVYATGPKTVQYLIAGNLDDNSPGKSSGVTGQAGYSASKDHWLASATLRRHRSPINPIFDASFQMKDDWDFADQQSIDLIRDAGFQITATGQEFACIIGLQETADADQLNYQNVAGFTESVINFDKTGNLNEMIEIFDGSVTDTRDFLKVYNRIQGKLYAEGNLLVDQDLAALTFVAYRIPLGNGNDPNILESDANIDSQAPYTGMDINWIEGSGFTTYADSTIYPAGAVVLDANVQSGGSSNGTWWFTPAGGTSSGANTGVDVGVTDWESFAGEVQIGDEWFAFNRIIRGNAGTDVEVHEYAQRQLRQTGNINDALVGGANQNAFGDVHGDVAPRMTRFEGGIKTFPGLYIENLDPSSRATAEFFDITVDSGGLDSESLPLVSTGRIFPFSSAGNLVFSANAVAETNVDTFYDMYFDYTRRDTATDFAVDTPVGNAANFTSGTLDLTTVYANGDYCAISGFTEVTLAGIFQVSAVLAGSMTITKVREPGVTLVAEVAGNSVNLDDDPFDTDDAVIVQDDTATDISGQITQINEPFTFAFDTNVQGGRTAGQPAPVTVVAQGLNDSKWVEANFTIQRQTGLSFPVNLGDEFVYNNP